VSSLSDELVILLIWRIIYRWGWERKEEKKRKRKKGNPEQSKGEGKSSRAVPHVIIRKAWK
jgi:hypothetical protein